MYRSIIAITMFLTSSAFICSQNVYSGKEFQFLSYEKIPTWVGVAINWEKDNPDIHLYDFNKYQGHAQYISVCLKTGITFKQFKEQVKNPTTRKYLPFFLYDLRDSEIELNNLKYSWALRIEDYQYEDNPKQMSETVLKLLNTIEKYIEKESGNNSKGIIILATGTKAIPNISIAETINRNGFPNLTLTQLLSKAGGKKVEILNPGKAIGYLKYVPAGQEENIKTTDKDILIYETLPRRVPPVSGIITLEPQTPLSHINLLAKNRGTINLYTTDIKNIPGSKLLLNKLVKINCTGKKISITEANEKEAGVYWNSRIIKINIPLPSDSVINIVDLNKNRSPGQSTCFVGAKAANYALIRQSFPDYVQKGYAIPFLWYLKTIKSCGADTLISVLIKNKPDVEERNKQLAQIRERIIGSEIDTTLLEELRTLLQSEFNESKVRFRSSTNCEDLPEFNGAGLYFSDGYSLKDGDLVLRAKILRVYASLWNPMAFEEREYYFIDHSKVAMAILINEAFSYEYANGVAITLSERNNVSLIINSQYGESSVTNPENGIIPESLLFSSENNNRFEILSKSGIHNIFLSNEVPLMLNELKNLVMEIHKTFTTQLNKTNKNKYGVDVEFKIMPENLSYKLYIKQARLLRSTLPE